MDLRQNAVTLFRILYGTEKPGEWGHRPGQRDTLFRRAAGTSKSSGPELPEPEKACTDPIQRIFLDVDVAVWSKIHAISGIEVQSPFPVCRSARIE
jgi:hypothetical protein